MSLAEIVFETNVYKDFYNLSHNDSIYHDAKFRDFDLLAPTTKHKFATDFAFEIIARINGERGIQIRQGKSRDTIFVDGYKTSIKTSKLWENDQLCWQQIRLAREWQRIIFVAVFPNDINVWWATHDDIDYIVNNEDSIVAQHAEEVCFLSHNADEIPRWFRPISEWNS